MAETEIVEDRKAILSQVSLFTELKNVPQAIDSLSAIMKTRSFPKDHTLIKQGTSGDEFYVLAKGTVSISKETSESDHYKVVVLSHQNHPSFGEGGLMEGEVRSATIHCDTPVECLVLTRKDFDDFCKTAPQYALPILKRISQSLMLRLNQTSTDLMLLHKALMDEIRNS